MDARKLCEIPHAVVVMITLHPGESLKRHMTPVDVIFYVLEGIGTVETGDEKATAGKDTLIESPARIPHRWINDRRKIPLLFPYHSYEPKNLIGMKILYPSTRS